MNAPGDRFDAELPCDSVAEQNLIGCVLNDNALLATAAEAGIEARHFNVDGHDRIWSAIVELCEAGQPADVTAVLDRLDAAGVAEKCGGFEYLFRLPGCVINLDHVARYAARVRALAVQRDLIFGLEASLSIARGPDGAEKAMDVAQGTVERLRAVSRPPSARFELVAAADFGALPRMAWYVHSVLPTTGVAGIFGPSGAAKSFLGLDAIAAIAERRHWFGYRTKACRIVYVVLEGEAGFRRRVAAWEAHNDRPFPPEVLFLFGDFHLTSRDDVLGLAAAIDTAGGAGLIVVDTLNRAAPGVDENSPDGMGRILEGVKELQATTGGLVVLVHHAGKDATKGMRGHSSLFAALDAAIEVTRTDSRREWKVAKAKDGEDGKVHAFSLHVVDLGEDDDGKAITSCVVEPEQALEDTAPLVKLPTGGNQRIVLDALRPFFTASRHFGKPGAPAGRPCIEMEEALASVRDRLMVEPKRRGERARESITGLVAKGIVGHNDGWIWLK